ncbi:MAG TPA: type II secretion system F family protein [Gemmatimonadaceae bacterium]|nr:type II secretion system F family protein [Gemmatimonadaceae bacterium]
MSETVTFRYRAARADGTLELGTLGAASREQASALLAARGVWTLEIEERGSGVARKARMSAAELALGLRILADLLDAGLPIARALILLEALAPPSWRALLPVARDSVREGKSLARALGSAPVSLPPLVIGIVQAGEAGSGLALAVRRAAELMDDRARTDAALRSALAYPALLAIGGTAAVALLAGVVLPKFAAILADLGQALPPTTQLVLRVAAMVRATAIPAVIATAALAVVWLRWVSTPPGRARWHELLLASPGLGALRLSTATSRTLSALSALLDAGIPIAAALQHASGAAGDAAIAQRMTRVRTRVVHGERLSSALMEERGATATAARLARAGEETGQLAAMTARAAGIERERADRMVKSAIRFIEPGMIVAFGALVALVAAALLQAVYGVRPQP